MLTSGQSAPDFALQGFTLSEALTHAPVFLVFFKIACPTCQFTLPFLQSFGGSGLRVVLVSQDDEKNTARFLAGFQISLPVVFDKGRAFAVSNAYGITHVPSQFLVGQDGVIAASTECFDRPFLEQVGHRFGIALFSDQPGIPALKPG